MPIGIDASMPTTPYLSNLQALGVSFIGRYYTNLQRTRNPGKALTPNEAHAISALGISILSVWELLDTPGYFSYQQGNADGHYAYQYANTVIRQPEDSAIYFAVDFDASHEQYDQSVRPYFQGINDAFGEVGAGAPIYSVGVYGSGAVCAALKTAGVVRYSWLAQSTGWTGSGAYGGWDIKQGPQVSHPPFSFDQDVSKGDCGAFRLAFNGQNNFFT